MAKTQIKLEDLNNLFGSIISVSIDTNDRVLAVAIRKIEIFLEDKENVNLLNKYLEGLELTGEYNLA